LVAETKRSVQNSDWAKLRNNLVCGKINRKNIFHCLLPLKLFVDFKHIPHGNILTKEGFFAQDQTWKGLNASIV
jgi:hypothetical protein